MSKPFIHLRCLSSYSLSESTLKIKKLVSLAKKNNLPALAITDNNNMFGVFEFAQECVSNNIQPIIGSSINLLDVREKDKISQLSFLVKNETGYKNLIYLSSISYLNKNSDIGITIKDLENHSEGLFCFLGGEYNPLMILHNENKNIDELILIFKKLFKDNLLFELQRINDSDIDSFENILILLKFLIMENLEIKRHNELNTITEINANKYSPLCGSLANEWTLSIIPDLTINAPKRLKEKTVIDSNIVHVLRWEDFIETFNECSKAVAANHGIKATFSTGSQNQYPPQPNS